MARAKIVPIGDIETQSKKDGFFTEEQAESAYKGTKRSGAILEGFHKAFCIVLCHTETFSD